jgi:hypothetical protein
MKHTMHKEDSQNPTAEGGLAQGPSAAVPAAVPVGNMVAVRVANTGVGWVDLGSTVGEIAGAETGLKVRQKSTVRYGQGPRAQQGVLGL